MSLGFKPGYAKLKAQAEPLSYGDRLPTDKAFKWETVCISIQTRNSHHK